jgi:hypothetical protein
LQKAIELPETKDKTRARKLLEDSLLDTDETDLKFLAISKPKPSNRADESVPFTTLMLDGRNEFYGDPFDEFDPHHRISGKRAFNQQVRCL